MNWKKLLLIIPLFTFLLIDWSTNSHSKAPMENLVTMSIDGFEVPGEWVLKFSKFRSINWDKEPEKGFEEQSTFAWNSVRLHLDVGCYRTIQQL